MDIKPFMTLRNILIGGGVTAGVGLVGFSVVYNNDIENKIVNYNQLEFANDELESSAEKLIVLNGVGEVNIVQTDTDKVEVKSYILYNDDVKVEKLKVNEVDFEIENATLEGEEELETYILSSKLTDDSNYFTYLENEDYLNDVKINYEIEVPSSLKEIYVYNPLGDVKIYNADASVKVITYKGNVFVKSITPDDFVSVQNYEGDIDITLENVSTTTYIGASSYNGDINLEVKDSSKYEVGKDNPPVLAMENDIFETKAYERVENEFLKQDKFENKKLKASILSRKGEITLK